VKAWRFALFDVSAIDELVAWLKRCDDLNLKQILDKRYDSDQSQKAKDDHAGDRRPAAKQAPECDLP